MLKVTGLLLETGAVAVGFSVGCGECVGFETGPAGPGALFDCIDGRRRPVEGRIVLAGQDVQGLPAHAIVRLGVARMPDGRPTFPRLRVLDALLLAAFPRMTADLPPGALVRDLDRVFALFPELGQRRDALAEHLTPGGQEGLASARALMLAPRLLLVDGSERVGSTATIVIDAVLEDGAAVIIGAPAGASALTLTDRTVSAGGAL